MPNDAPLQVEKQDLVLYSKGVEGIFKNDQGRLDAVERAIEALERGESVHLLVGGNPTGTIMRARGSRYVEEIIR